MIRILTILIALTIFSHQSFAVEAVKKLTKEQQELRKENEKIVNKYIKKLKSYSFLLPASFEEAFKKSEIEIYHKTVPNLKKQCEKVSKKEAYLNSTLKKYNEEFKKEFEEYSNLDDSAKEKKLEVFRKQRKSIINSELGKFLNKKFTGSAKKINKADAELFKENYKLDLMTLEHIVKDYKKKNLILPVDWVKK